MIRQNSMWWWKRMKLNLIRLKFSAHIQLQTKQHMITLAIADQTACDGEWDFGSQPLPLHSPGKRRSICFPALETIATGNVQSCWLAISSVLFWNFWIEEEKWSISLTKFSGRQQPWLQNLVLPLLQVNLTRSWIRNLQSCWSEIGSVLDNDD